MTTQIYDARKHYLNRFANLNVGDMDFSKMPTYRIGELVIELEQAEEAGRLNLETWEGVDTLSIIARKYEKSRFMAEVTFEGKTYWVNGSEAFQTNNVFPGWFGDAEEGETYTDQWAENGIDDEGNNVQVIWQWEMVKGEEPEDGGEYPWCDENIIAVVEQ